MKKNINISILLFVIILAITVVSCKKEVITLDPEEVYDKGERLRLSNNLLILDESELTHGGGIAGILFDETSQILKVDAITLESEPDTGMVMHIEREGNVLLRKITGVNKTNGEYILQTVQSNITEVFDDANVNFDFNPEFSNNQLKTQDIASLKGVALSNALTDSESGIHPSEIRLIIGETEKILFSVEKNIPLLATKSTPNNKVGFEHQFNVDQTIVSVGLIELILEDFGFSWYSNLKANFYTEQKFHYVFGHKMYPPYYVAAKFDATATDMDIKAWFDVKAVVEGEKSLVNETDPILLPFTLQFQFPVGAVPVIIGIEFALNLGVEISVTGKAQVSTGYTVEYNIPKMMVGGYTSIENFQTYSGVTYDYTPGKIVDNYFHPLKLEAMATVKQIYTLKPTMGFSLYRLAGPEINLAIGTEFDFSVGGGVSISLEDSSAPKAYIGWDGKLSSKVGAGGGAWIDAFGALNKHWDIPTITLLPNIPIWHTPESMARSYDNNFSSTIVGQKKEVEVKVRDSWTFPSPMIFVQWISDGGGHWEKPMTMAIDGSSKNTWVPTSAGSHAPYCYIKNGELKEVDRVTFNTTTTEATPGS